MKVFSKLLFILIIFFLSLTQLEAQISIGIQGGLSLPNLTDGNNNISRGYSSRMAPNFGILGDYQLSDHFALQAEVNFDGQGGQRRGLQPITSTDLPPLPSGGDYYAKFKNVSILNYLEIPVTLKYKLKKGIFSYFVDAGPFVGFLLNAKEESSGTSPIYVDNKGTLLMEPIPPDYQQYAPVPPQSFNSTTDVTDSINKVNFGVCGSIGISYDLTHSTSIFLEAHGLYGFTNVQKYSVDGKSHTGNLCITAGYMFRI